MSELGKTLVIFGAVIVVLGITLLLVGKVPFIGRLPGDIVWKRGDFTLYLPITTSVILSAVLTALLYVITRLKGQ
ncbi:MAG: DUF2905 domain-containing protein [Planctomycetota bacterium]|jgi:hypothetical protein